MLNSVNMSPSFIFDFLLLFLTRDCIPFILRSSFETLFSANMDDFKCSSVKEQNKPPFKEEEELPRGWFRRREEEG